MSGKPQTTVEQSVSILGARIHQFADYGYAYRAVVQTLQQGGAPGYITVNNVHTVIEAVQDRSYGEIINHAAMALADGKPLSVVARWKGIQPASRIFGPTFMEKSLAWGQAHGLKHFFFGSSPETLEKLVLFCQQRFPKVQIVGAISPPFRAFTEAENARFLREMNQSGADIDWVGLGAPRQERWMAANYQKLHHGVMIGIGAGFDYLAGNTRHAPEWMKNASLEWLYRLLQEPRRLWKRYLVTNSLFIYYLILEFLGLKKFE